MVLSDWDAPLPVMPVAGAYPSVAAKAQVVMTADMATAEKTFNIANTPKCAHAMRTEPIVLQFQSVQHYLLIKPIADAC